VAIYVERADNAVQKPVEPVDVQPVSVKVCPRCEMATGPLMAFCQNSPCPMKG
jgi:hypothetical protein